MALLDNRLMFEQYEKSRSNKVISEIAAPANPNDDKILNKQKEIQNNNLSDSHQTPGTTTELAQLIIDELKYAEGTVIKLSEGSGAHIIQWAQQIIELQKN